MAEPEIGEDAVGVLLILKEGVGGGTVETGEIVVPGAFVLLLG